MILPINLIEIGLVSLPFLYARMIFCTPVQSTSPFPSLLSFTVTVSLFSSVTYTTIALLFNVPSSLYAPEAVPFTHANPDLSCALTFKESVTAALLGNSFPSFTGTTFIT